MSMPALAALAGVTGLARRRNANAMAARPRPDSSTSDGSGMNVTEESVMLTPMLPSIPAVAGAVQVNVASEPLR